MRGKYLDKIAPNAHALWSEIESLIVTKEAKSYERATQLLVDLRDLAARRGDSGFQSRIEALRGRHDRKRTFLKALLKAGL